MARSGMVADEGEHRTGRDREQGPAKLGLALSGGGFRAAFFHVGVLARMAEMRLLRDVDVISTVSGGSIVGALYYLILKRRLEDGYPDGIKDEGYVGVVEHVADVFSEAVKTNFRWRTFTHPLRNLQMVKPSYSRTDRLGDLFDECLYRPAAGVGRPVRMLDLKPLRGVKVPKLVINATTLNTGHTWRFEAESMGEPQREPEGREIDRNAWLARPDSYENTPYEDFPLGKAVAASACFPAFPPFPISRLYRGWRVRLVDGGVHDNQGVQSLVKEDCDRLVVSDGSGQMSDLRRPNPIFLAVLGREASIFSDRVREEQLLGLEPPISRRAVLHLRRGVALEVVPWVKGSGADADALAFEDPSSVAFGVAPEAQAALAEIRTDLDSFTEVESGSLMADGYLMAGHGFVGKQLADRIVGPPLPRAGWSFLPLLAHLETPSEQYLHQLRVGRHRFFKLLRLKPWLWWSFVALTILVVAGLVSARTDRLTAALLFLLSGVVVLALLALAALAVGLVLAVVLRLVLWGLDRAFLTAGEIENLPPPPRTPTGEGGIPSRHEH